MPSSKKRSITAEDLYRFELIANLRYSPDGKLVIYAQKRVDQKTQKKYANLWVVPAAEGTPRQFTFGDQTDAQPRWSPSGEQIVFLSDRADKEKPPQLYVMRIDGGEARPLSNIAGSIGAFSWAPDGKSILCSVQKTDAEVLKRDKDEQKKKLGVVDRQYERLFYKLDGIGYLPKERTHLWTVDAVSGKARQLTDHAVYDEQAPAWSPDGKWIALISNRSTDPDLRPNADDLFVMPAKGGDLRLIPTPAGPKSQPSFSPDGRWIAYYGVDSEELEYKNTSLWIVPADGLSAARSLTGAYDLHVSAWTINDMGEPEMMAPTWTNDSRSIFFQVTIHGSTILMKTDLAGSQPVTIIAEGGVVGSFSLDHGQNSVAYFWGEMDDPGQVMILDLGTRKTRQLTHINRGLLDQIQLSQVKEVWYKGADGVDLHGWIMTPPDFTAGKKYPSILEIHGGPRLQYGKFFMHEFYYLAAQGYVVTFTNPRGGRGYGEAHTQAIWQDWGNADYADLMAWADVVQKEAFIDPMRMGVTGGSYGGYMTVWIIGHTHRFHAAVAMRCVSNFVSMWGSSDFNWTFQNEIGGLPPYEDLDNFWKHSPIAYIGNASTPTMVIHNEFDLRCPIEQGEQVFVALKKLGVPTEMIRFPDEFHGLSRTGRTDRKIARLNHIRRWFDRYLKS